MARSVSPTGPRLLTRRVRRPPTSRSRIPSGIRSDGVTSAGTPAPGLPRPSIPWHRRLEARVLVSVTLIAGLSLASVTVVTGRVVRSHSLDRARGDLSAVQVAFAHLITTRAEFAESQTK